MHALLLISYHVLRRRLACRELRSNCFTRRNGTVRIRSYRRRLRELGWLLCVSPAAGPDDGDVCAAPAPFRAVQEGRNLEISEIAGRAPRRGSYP